MARRAAYRRLAWWVSLVLVVAALATAVGVLTEAGPGVSVGFILVSLWIGAALSVVGGLLLRARTGGLLGPILLVGGASLVAEFSLRTYAYIGQLDGSAEPRHTLTGWLGLALDPIFFPALLIMILLLFPDGRIRSRLNRAVMVVVVVAVAVEVIALAIRSGPLEDASFGYDIPWRGVVRSGDLVAELPARINSILVFVLMGCALWFVVRFARARGVTRQQFKPLLIVVGVMAAGLIIQSFDATRQLGVLTLVASVTLGLPLALAVAVLRYRLWDLDRAIIATLVYGALAVGVIGVYVAIVVGISTLIGRTEPPIALSIAATALVALGFAPAREALTHRARRLVYGERASPYESLTALPHQLADAPDVDVVLPRIAEALRAGLGLPAARVRVLLGDDSTLTAWSPPETSGEAPELHVVEVRQLGRIVGDVAVVRPADRTLGRTDERLLVDLAAQAGPALHGVALTAQLRARIEEITVQSEELRASRERLATATVEERRRLERDIHDGAQQQLVGLAVHLAEIEETAQLTELPAVRRELDACIDALREFARGVYPPVLIARGLVPALRARLRTLTADVELIDEGVGDHRFGERIEVAVYFCCLEALQNIAKHAPDSIGRISLRLENDLLIFEVADDGPGLDVDAAPVSGSGLIGMADRIGAAGGDLKIISSPGTGTLISGRLPLEAGGHAA